MGGFNSFDYYGRACIFFIFHLIVLQLFFRLTGASPFYGKTYNEILMKNIKCQVNYNFKEMNVKLTDDCKYFFLKISAFFF